MTAPVSLVWFKRDLRVEDHAPLCAATAAGRVVPVYVAEPDWWAQPTMSGRQWRFVADSLRALDADLTALGAPLVLRLGDAAQELARLAAETGATTVHAHQETGDAWSFARDRRVAAWARGAGVALVEHQAAGVVRRLPTRDGWARRWDATMRAPALTPQALTPVAPAPSSLQVPDAPALGLPADPGDARPGGRAAALATLGGFLHSRGRDYRAAMASPVTGFDACSRLSPHLAWGTLSTREAAQAGWARQAEAAADGDGKWRGAMDSFLARLHWRCHFMQKLEDEPAIEFRCMHRAYEGMREDDHDPTRLAAWERGETGYPFVDACLRALATTGWMNFRMRSMLTAFAAYHLWLDWRRIAPPMARWFTDYEPGIHYSQLQMQSGVTGINTTRVYNPVKQSQDQDPEGVFIRRWCPELTGVPTTFIHEPWRMPPLEARAVGLAIGETYPARIVNHENAARVAKERIHAVRRSAAFRDDARAVLKKHASRKPGRDGFVRRPRPDARQGMLDF